MGKRETMLKMYLEQTPRGRERRNKVRCVSNIIQKNHPSIQGIPPEVMCEIVDEVISYERYWRKILLEHPHLRGTDYNTKKMVVQKKQMELGYEPSALTKDFEEALDRDINIKEKTDESK